MGKDQLSVLKWSLQDVRDVTLEGISHLTKEQLHNIPVSGEYPIGSYLMHLAECDIFWLEMLSGKTQSEDLKKRSFADVWFDPPKDATPSPPAEALEINVYMDVLTEARKNFYDHMDSMDDSELEEVVTVPSGWKASKKWIIYHILEHEAHHRGQMFLLLRQAGWKKQK